MRSVSFILIFAATALMPGQALASQMSEVVETSLWDQVTEFFRLEEPSLQRALIGSLLLGVSCGLLGSFIVVRKMALVGDAISHAVLPGVALGFLWNMTKDPVAILIGATGAGLLGALTVNWITRTTKLKSDAALGLVLASFFALGVVMMTRIQNSGNSEQSGLDRFLFGQAAAIGWNDVWIMAATTLGSVLLIWLLYRPLMVMSFDVEFAACCGYPVRLLNNIFMLLLAFAIVISLQAVGVVLVSAMLITPAASAYLLTDRLSRMLLYSSLIGMMAGVMGCFFSFLKTGMPTGPLMVVSASAVFAAVFVFAPRHGLLSRWLLHRNQSKRIERENTLKAVYRVLENRDFAGEGVSLRELATLRRETIEDVMAQAAELRRSGEATLAGDGETILLTPPGMKHARRIVRNHRLWELYLTNSAHYEPDHVHDDAEKIEHILGEEMVRELEKRLDYPETDPHGKPIPDVYGPRESGDRFEAPAGSGYGGRRRG